MTTRLRHKNAGGNSWDVLKILQSLTVATGNFSKKAAVGAAPQLSLLVKSMNFILQTDTSSILGLPPFIITVTINPSTSREQVPWIKFAGSVQSSNPTFGISVGEIRIQNSGVDEL